LLNLLTRSGDDWQLSPEQVRLERTLLAGYLQRGREGMVDLAEVLLQVWPRINKNIFFFQ
jgi:hypothetical protein